MVEFWQAIPPWQRLANAIVQQAAHDYRVALRGLQLDSNSISSMHKAHEVELFFRSEWQMALTKLDGEYLIEQLRKESSQSEPIRGNKNNSFGGRQ